MNTSTLVRPARAKILLLLVGSLGATALGGCYHDDDKNSGDKEVDVPVAVTLATREDVIQAVATVWNFAGPWAQATAPARATAPEQAAGGGAKAEGPVTEDCTTSGTVTYDDMAKVTTYNNCTETTESTDETTGTTVSATSVLDGTVNEACLLDEGETEPTDARCFNAAPLDLTSDTVTTTPATETEDETTVTEGLEVQRDAYLEISQESDTGYRLLISEERQQKATYQDDTGTTTSKAKIATEGFEIRMENTGDAETPVYTFDLNGEAFFEDDGANCSAGLLRIGSATPIAVDPSNGYAPTDGTLVLSTDAVAALAVDFAADRSISFRLNGEDLTATAEELAAACLGSYRIPEDGANDEDPPADEICLFDPICFPGGF